MLRPIRRQRAFADLGRSRVRARSGPVWIRVDRMPDVPGTVEVGYAIGRQVGSAVVRNTIRRRLRVMLRDAARAGDLAPGRYLVGVGPAVTELTFDALRDHVRQVVDEVAP